MPLLTPEENNELIALGDLSLKELRDRAYSHIQETAGSIARNWSRGNLIALLFEKYQQGLRHPISGGTRRESASS